MVDFGADGGYQGGDDSEQEVTFDSTTTPALQDGQWIGLDLPFSELTGLTSRAHLAQMILSSSAGATVYVDNVYFYRIGGTPPPAPAVLFADDYASGLSFVAFGGSANALTLDTAVWHSPEAVVTRP